MCDTKTHASWLCWYCVVECCEWAVREAREGGRGEDGQYCILALSPWSRPCLSWFCLLDSWPISSLLTSHWLKIHFIGQYLTLVSLPSHCLKLLLFGSKLILLSRTSYWLKHPLNGLIGHSVFKPLSQTKMTSDWPIGNPSLTWLKSRYHPSLKTLSLASDGSLPCRCW